MLKDKEIYNPFFFPPKKYLDLALWVDFFRTLLSCLYTSLAWENIKISLWSSDPPKPVRRNRDEKKDL